MKVFKKLNNKRRELSPLEKKKYLSLFMVMCFSILLAMTSAINETFVRILFQVILFCAQLVIVKLLLDDYYSR